MALTLTEAAKLTNDVLLRGVIETIIEDSMVLQMLPFQDLTGTALTYNQESMAPTVAWLDVGDVWTESTPTFTQKQAVLRILGGDADVDNFLQQTYRNPNDLEAEVIAAKAKAMSYSFLDTFYNGDNNVNSRQPDGLEIVTPSAQTIAAGTTGAPLELEMLDVLIDMIKPGRPHALLMAKRTRRELTALMREAGQQTGEGRDAFGRRVVTYDDIPIIADDFIRTDEEVDTGVETGSSIYAVRWGRTGVVGIQNGGIQVERVGELETKDATRTRIKWYVGGPVVLAPLGIARLKFITPPA